AVDLLLGHLAGIAVDVAKALSDEAARQNVLEDRGDERQPRQARQPKSERHRGRVWRGAAAGGPDGVFDPRGRRERRAPGDRAAERIAAEHAALDAELVEERNEQPDIVL